MKYITQNWLDENDGYLFFIQRLQEMLFHYSDDIVKAPVHNTQTLLEEYVEMDKKVKTNGGATSHLIYIALEIFNSFSNDPVIREMYSEDILKEILNKFSKNGNNTAIIYYLYNRIDYRQYYDKCIKYLKDKIKDKQNKSEIEKGIRIWIASAVWHGYKPEYIFGFLKRVFDLEVKNPQEALNQFLDRFNFENHKYRVYFVFSGKLRCYKELLLQKNMRFADDGNFQLINITKNNKNGFIGYIEVAELDDYMAMEKAYDLLNKILRIYKVLTNKKDTIDKKGMVYNLETDEYIFLPVRSKGYKNIEASPEENYIKEITWIISKSTKDNPTFETLIRSIDSHNASLEQDDLNDAFLNLWSSLEVIATSADDEAKMNGIIKNVIPILQKDYFTCLFLNIYCDLKDNLGKRGVDRLLSHISEFKNEIHKIAAFVFLDKYENLREQYFEKELKKYSNIRNKIYILWSKRKNESEIWKLSENYRQRILWHMYRLYRLRNAIVHEGETHKRIQVLGEHLHIYVDRTINEVMAKFTNDKSIITMQDVFVDTQLLLNKKKNILKNSNQPMNEQSITLLFDDYFILNFN